MNKQEQKQAKTNLQEIKELFGTVFKAGCLGIFIFIAFATIISILKCC